MTHITLDLSAYRTKTEQADITKVANDTDFIEVSDEHEHEFSFGDPQKQVSLDACGKELSSSVKIAPQNIAHAQWYQPKEGTNDPDFDKPVGQRQTAAGHDVTPVVTFNDRAKLVSKISDEFVASGGWLHSSLEGGGLNASIGLSVERGFMFEPGTNVVFAAAGQQHKIEVPADDAELIGSPAFSFAFNQGTLMNVLNDWRPTARVTGGNQQTVHTLPRGIEMLGAYPESVTSNVIIAGKALVPLSTQIATGALADHKLAATKTPLPNDPECNGQRVKIDLPADFIEVNNGASIKGWKLVAGYTDEQGKWHGCSPVTNDDPKFCARSLTVDVQDAAALLANDRRLQIRVFNADNVPAKSVEIPLRSIKWA